MARPSCLEGRLCRTVRDMTSLQRKATALRAAVEAAKKSSKSVAEHQHDREVLRQCVVDAYMAGVEPHELVAEVPGVKRPTIYSWLPEGAAAKRKGAKKRATRRRPSFSRSPNTSSNTPTCRGSM